MEKTKLAPNQCKDKINSIQKCAEHTVNAPCTESASAESIQKLRTADRKLHAWTEFVPLSSFNLHSSNNLLNKQYFGVKDNLDVQGLHTQAGSRSQSHLPAATKDALVVERLRKVGAYPIGKTVTTEFAFRDPTTTKNPYHLAHTPGGSSSGSAAAVGAGHVPFALATQTAGSLNRPAAYCGVFGIKPSYNLLPTDGVRPLSPSFDTIGVISKDLSIGAEAIAVMADDRTLSQARLPKSVRWATLSARFFKNSTNCVQENHTATLTCIERQYGAVKELDLDIDFQAIVEHQRTVMLFEAYALYQHLLQKPELLKPEFCKALREGERIHQETMAASIHALAIARKQVWDAFSSYDAVVLQPVPSPAPHGLGSTGDQSYLTPWTVFWGPLVTIPTTLNPAGLPLATMLAAPPGEDAKLIALAQWLTQQVYQMPEPQFMV